jgi:hypothetical protein
MSRSWFNDTINRRKEEFRNKNMAARKQESNLHTCLNKKLASDNKLKPYTRIRGATLNVKSFNTITKREVVTQLMKDQGYDIMLLTETNVNLNSWEKWDGFVCIFSTGVDPKVREREEKKRENTKMAPYNPGIYRNNYRTCPDFENAGVGIVIRNGLLSSLTDIRQINGRIMAATFDSTGSPLTFITAYVPHGGYNTEIKEDFYEDLSSEIPNTRGIFYIGGDFNARIHHVRDTDIDVCGRNIIGRRMEYLNIMNENSKENRALFLGFCKMHNLYIMNI